MSDSFVDPDAAAGGLTPTQGQFGVALVPPAAPADPTTLDTLHAAFDLNNDVVNAVHWLARPAFKTDPAYTTEKLLSDIGTGSIYEQKYLDDFVGSHSAEETRAIKARIDKENNENDILERSGAMGWVANLAAGVASPLTAIPVGGYLRAASKGANIALRALETGVASGGVTAVQEAFLHQTQETRTLEQSVWASLGSTILGSVLGGAAGAIGGHAVDGIAERAAKEFGLTDSNHPAPEPAPAVGQQEPIAAGAAVSDQRGSGEIKGALGFERTPIKEQDPKFRTVTSEDPVTRNTVRDLVSVPELAENERGIASSVGGSVEMRAKASQRALSAEMATTLDRGYQDYFFGKRRVPFFRPVSTLARWTGQAGDRLSYGDFKAAVFDAWLEGSQHPVPQVAKAAQALTTINDRLRIDAADGKVPGFSQDMKPQSGDKQYVPRVVDRPKIVADRPGFKNMLMAGINRTREKIIARTEESRAARTASLQQQIGDLNLSGDERAANLTRLSDELKAHLAANKQHLPTDQALSDLRSRAFAARSAGDNRAASTISAEVSSRVQAAGTDYANYVTKRNALATRLRNIRNNIVGRESQVERLRGAIADTEAANVDRLWRMHRAVAKLETDLDTMTPEAIAAELSSLRTDFAKTLERSTKAQDRLAAAKVKMATEGKAAHDAGDIVRATAIEAELNRGDPFVAEAKNVDELNQLAERIGEVEEVDPDMAAMELRTLIERRIDQSAAVVEDAGRRIDVLAERARKADPELVKARVESLKAKIEHLKNAAMSKAAEMSPAEVEAAAEELTNTYLGHSPARLVMPEDVSAGPRGPLKERMVNFVSTKEMAPWLVRDPEIIMRRAIRTMTTDTELMRKFGSTTMADQFQKMIDSATARQRAIPEGTTPAEKAAAAKARTRINAALEADLRDLSAMRDIVRGTYGIPDNPDGLAARSMRTAMQLSSMAHLGGSSIPSSLSDAAKVIFVHNVDRAFGLMFAPLVHGWRAIKLAKPDVLTAGVGLDLIRSDRILQMADLMDNEGRGSRFEKVVDAASSNFFKINLMAPWNAFWKQFAGIITMTRMLQAIDRWSTGTISAKEKAYLGAGGINDLLAQRIAAHFNANGEKIGGHVWVANTDKWLKPDGTPDMPAISAFRAFLTRDVDRTIVTPGAGDKPLMLSKGMGHVIGQFRSFNIASVQHTILAGLQQRDAAALSGSLLMLGLGAMTYYVRSFTTGTPLSDDPKKWMVEAFDNSGLAGWFMDADHAMERITRGNVGLSRLTGEYASRYQSQGDLGMISPLLEDAWSLKGLIGDIASGDVSASDIHTARSLLPWENVFWYRRMLDSVEHGVDHAFGIPLRPKPH